MTRTEIILAILAYLAVTFLFIFNTVMRPGKFGINFEAVSNGIVISAKVSLP